MNRDKLRSLFAQCSDFKWSSICKSAGVNTSNFYQFVKGNNSALSEDKANQIYELFKQRISDINQKIA